MNPRNSIRATRCAIALLAAACLTLPAGAAAAAETQGTGSAQGAAEAQNAPQAQSAPSAQDAAEARSTPSPSTHRIGALCPTPPPGSSGCLGLRLVPDEAEPHGERKSPVNGSLAPASLLKAYDLTGVTPPSTQTIALVDAYDDATAEADLAVFDSRFGLPACTEANGCFEKVNQKGKASPLPASSGPEERGWAQEIATDVEVAHGICPDCRILLVEADSNANSDLYAAEQTAVALGATEISNSWGGREPKSDNTAFNHPGIVITASSGDEGYLDWLTGEPSNAAQYPASSPHVVGVGGTRLQLNAESGAWEGETVWNDGGFSGSEFEGAGAGGGGCSAHFAAAIWQQSVPDWSSVGCGGARAVADVSADADPYTGVAVYDSTETPEGEKGWAMIGGTSVASPLVASVFALAGGAHGVAYPSQTLYENLLADPSSVHDVASGSNGECLKKPSRKTGASSCEAREEAELSCAGQAICLAGAGYDGPSGVGSPDGIDAFVPLTEHGSAGVVTPSETSPSQATGTSSPGAGEAASAAPPAAAQPSSPATTTGVRPTVGGLALTRRAIAATTHRRTRVSTLAFSFRLNVAARVRVTLTRLVRVHGRARWRTVTAPFAFLARAGAQARSLRGRATLSRGRYRLTVAPAGGTAKTLTFRVR